jgi:hypothetical protein
LNPKIKVNSFTLEQIYRSQNSLNTGLNSINGVKLLKMFYQEYDVIVVGSQFWLQAAAAAIWVLNFVGYNELANIACLVQPCNGGIAKGQIVRRLMLLEVL